MVQEKFPVRVYDDSWNEQSEILMLTEQQFDDLAESLPLGWFIESVDN